MAKISIKPIDSDIDGSEKILGTNGDGVTMNYPINTLIAYLISKIDIGGIINDPTEVYFFQFDSLSLAIGDSALVTTDWLAANATKIVESAFLDGIVVPLPTIGRIGFTIKADTGAYSIYDELGQNVTDIVFNTTTDAAEGRQIFISKEYYAYSTLYYRLIKN